MPTFISFQPVIFLKSSRITLLLCCSARQLQQPHPTVASFSPLAQQLLNILLTLLLHLQLGKTIH